MRRGNRERKKRGMSSSHVIPTVITLLTGMCVTCQDELDDPLSMGSDDDNQDDITRSIKCSRGDVITPSEFASTFSDTEIQAFVTALARRPEGREAILNCVPVVRALTASKRLGQRSVKERRDMELTKVTLILTSSIA